jgi:CBS domain-containing protein
MTPTLSGATSLEHLLGMDQAGVNRVPVVNSAGRPVGILTRDDVLRVLAQRIRHPRPAASRGSPMAPD